jgi:hypothetical protein
MMRLAPPRSLTFPEPNNRAVPLSAYLSKYAGSSDFVNAAASVSVSVAVTASGTPHTKGSWAQVVASTTTDVTAIEIFALTNTFQTGTNTSTLLDIGVGGSGSEQVIVPNINVGYEFLGVGMWEFPVFIPAGSRVALRSQSAVASKAVTFGVRAKATRYQLKPASYCTTYGAVTGSSRGTILSAPGATDTEGSWTELTAATSERLAGLVLCPSGAGVTTLQNGSVLVDVAVGASSSEVSIIANQIVMIDTSERVLPQGGPRVHAVSIPAGSRISARYMTSTTSNDLDLLVVGIPWRP